MRTIALLAVVTLTSCAAPAPRPMPPAHAGPELVVHVEEAGDPHLEGLSGVTVTAITADGREIPAGRTFGGDVRLDKASLRAENARLLLFCLEAHHCVALRIANDSLYDFDEYWVDLPKLVLR
jgi:hypothetical protein